MKKPTPFILGGALGLLFGCIYFTSETKIQASPKQPTDHKQRPASQTRSYVHKGSEKNVSSEIKESYAMLYTLYGEKLETQLSEITFDDAKSLAIFVLSKSTPLEGLDWKNKRLLEHNLLQMAKKDLEATCEWIELTFPTESQNYFYKKIVKDHFEDQPKEALDFAHKYMDQLGVVNTLRQLYIQRKPLDNDTAEFLLENTEVSNKGGSGSGVQFANDFDFLRFGNAALDLSRSEAEDMPKLSVFPTNFLEEWAKRDPEAAMTFYNQNLTNKNGVQLPFNEIDNLVEGYLSVAPDDQASSWLASVLQPDNLSHSDRGDVMTDLTSGKIVSLDVLRETVRQMDLPNVKTLDFYSATTGGGGESYKDGRLLSLRLFPSPQARMDALKLHYQSPKERFQNQTDNQFKELCQQLKTLGHSEDEINRLREVKEQTAKEN